jgi:hypothetical protein
MDWHKIPSRRLRHTYAIARRIEALTVTGRDTPGELCRIARECLELARAQPDEELVRLAAAFAAGVRMKYPLEAQAAGL